MLAIQASVVAASEVSLPSALCPREELARTASVDDPVLGAYDPGAEAEAALERAAHVVRA